jgi:DNA-binding transcriptional regulator YdaS (Cro superfamily)
MTPADLRAICDDMNPGGQTRLAKLIGIHPTLLRKKLAGKVGISKVDELAIKHVVAGWKRRKKTRRGRNGTPAPTSTKPQ